MFLKEAVLKLVTVMLIACASLVTTAEAAVLQSAFGDAYQPVPAVSVSQSQVVYYRPGTPGERAAPAFVYVDKEFHVGLLPGGYTVFCVAPGRHGLSSVLGDEPRYAGKTVQPGVRLEPGKTHFIRVSDAGSLEPQLMDREAAERELAGTLRQVHVVSRASAVNACDYVQTPEVRSYSFSSDMLFGFGKYSREDIRDQGLAQMEKLLRQLVTDDLKVARIDVVGHTDAIGTDAYNDELGLRRAQTLRQLLIESGISPQRISARSMGRRQPMSNGCHGARSDVIKCLAPDRRVVIEVAADAGR